MSSRPESTNGSIHRFQVPASSRRKTAYGSTSAATRAAGPAMTPIVRPSTERMYPMEPARGPEPCTAGAE